MTQIYTSYFSKIKEIKEKFKRPCFISIARHVNSSIQENIHYCIPHFMPHCSLLNNYKNAIINEEQYEEIYLKQLNDVADGKLTKYNICPNPEWFDGIFILCYEGANSFCHRHILRRWLNNEHGFNMEEYGQVVEDIFV